MIEPLLRKKTTLHQLSRSLWIYFLFLFSGVASLIYQMIIKVFLLSPIELKFEPHSNKIIFRNEKKSGQQKKTF